MIYLMLYSRRCGHLYVFNYNHRGVQGGMHLCKCWHSGKAEGW